MLIIPLLLAIILGFESDDPANTHTEFFNISAHCILTKNVSFGTITVCDYYRDLGTAAARETKAICQDFANGGTWVEGFDCPSENRVGRCQYTKIGIDSVQSDYKPTTAGESQYHCQQIEPIGSWISG